MIILWNKYGLIKKQVFIKTNGRRGIENKIYSFRFKFNEVKNLIHDSNQLNLLFDVNIGFQLILGIQNTEDNIQHEQKNPMIVNIEYRASRICR